MSDSRDERIAAVMCDLELLEARDQAIAAARPGRHGGAGPSVVYSVRLDRDEVAALETQAALSGIKPTVLARNLIRAGLAAPDDQEVPRAVERVEAAVAELRALVW